MLDPADNLTPRQIELIALYASGSQIAEIAETKFLSPHTVRNNFALARERTGAKSLTHLCVICLEHGIIAKDGSGYKPVQVEGVVGE